MSFVKRHVRVLAVAVSCLGLGAGASAIASAGASTSSTAHPAKTAAAHRGVRAQLRRAVQGEFVVHTRKGFVTVRFDRGFVQSVSGNTLTLREGTAKATYKTVSLTIPASARVRNNGKRSTLASLTAGEHVGVFQGPARTLVVGRTVR